MKAKSIILLGFLFLGSNCFSVVAPNTVFATINVGVNPAGIAITPDSKFAYVANNNNYGIPGGNTVSVLNLQNNTLAQTISDSSFNSPYTVSIKNNRAYVTNSAGATVTVISTKTNKVIAVIDGFDGPSGMAITPDGKFGYVNNYGGPILGSGNGRTVSVVNLKTNKIVGAPITVGQAPAALALSPNGAYLYVINYVTGNTRAGTMSIVRTSDNTVIGTIKGFSGPFAISITPNGKYAYVTNFGSNNFSPIGTTVSVVDLKRNIIIKNIKLAIQPAGIAITPDGKYAYATNYNTLYAGAGFTDLTAGQGTVNIIDTKTNKVVPPIIAVGQSPDAVAISTNGEFAYVSNFISNTVSVIALQSFQITASGSQISRCICNRRIYSNKIVCTASGESLPVSYIIYRDAQLTRVAGVIAPTSGKGPFSFLDCFVKPGTTYNYYIVGVNKVGTASKPVVVTIK